ncbi:MAG TPA: endonuclease domain-containing protein [Archangium sp.]|nr:endonuclease domain-containing protein [Archangium sp.]
MKDLAQENRENPTKAEAVLWTYLSNKQLGVTFWRQHCLNANGRDYILDFYCASFKLAVEIDGPIHQFQQKDDAIREWRIEQLGIRVLRFSNAEVLRNPQRVASKILNAMRED